MIKKRIRQCSWDLERYSSTWISEACSKGLNILLKHEDFLTFAEAQLEVFQLLALLLLNLQSDLEAPIQEFGDLLEVSLRASSCRHRWRADAHTARRQG